MPFTYNLASPNEAIKNISLVRLELGDTVQNAGVRPDGANLQDDEIAVWLEEESDHIMHTVIRASQALARMWSNVASITVGPRREELGKVAETWLKNAQALIDQYGLPAGSGSAWSMTPNRIDGYSQANTDEFGRV
jgi:hypothetical protein